MVSQKFKIFSLLSCLNGTHRCSIVSTCLVETKHVVSCVEKPTHLAAAPNLLAQIATNPDVVVANCFNHKEEKFLVWLKFLFCKKKLTFWCN